MLSNGEALMLLLCGTVATKDKEVTSVCNKCTECRSSTMSVLEYILQVQSNI